MKKEFAFIICILTFFFGMIYGVIAHTVKWFPYQYLDNVSVVADSLAGALSIDKYNDMTRWVKPMPDKAGMVLKSESAMNGKYLVYTTTHDTTVSMVDAFGETVHEWTMSPNEIWPEQEQVIALKKLDDYYFYARDFYVYDNGDIIVMLSAAGVTPWGMGIVKLDKDSNLIWKYDGYVNNDFELDANGNIYVVEHMIREENIKAMDYNMTPFLEDNITLLSAETGEVMEQFSLVDAIDNSEFANLLRGFEDNTDGDPTHSNNIEYVESDHPYVPWIKEGYLLISIRNLHALAVVDPKTQKIINAYRLPAKMQHDVDLLKNGNLMIYDNRGNVTAGGYTRVIEFKPDTQEIVWSYAAEGDNEFDTDFWGMQDRFENGNTMIVNSTAGRIFEVTPNKDKLWEYVVPLYKSIDGKDMIATVTTAEMINAARLNFLNGERVEE